MTPSSNKGPNDYQVVVVGFGPAGAVATSLLGSHSIRTLTIDRLRTVYDKPRAIAIDHEILRLFDNLGVTQYRLERTRVLEGEEGVTHLHYRVRR